MLGKISEDYIFMKSSPASSAVAFSFAIRITGLVFNLVLSLSSS
jgi:hypothetical protein